MSTDTSKNSLDLITVVNAIALTLVIVGALNWGTTAYGYNLVEMVGGKDTVLSKGVYVAVAVAALYVVVALAMKKMKFKC
jgi:uncharacterized membrane protein YuzA (DUF378 family)